MALRFGGLSWALALLIPLAGCGPSTASGDRQANAAPASAGNLIPASGSAAGQQNTPGAFSLVGAWTGEAPAQGGHLRTTLAFNQDGTFVSVTRYPNGGAEKSWGGYSAQARSPTQIHLDVRRQDWAPHQMCSQAPGFTVKCANYDPPPTTSVDVTVISTTSIQVLGVQLSRDTSPDLLNQPVPEQAFTMARAPVTPNIRPPVMPTLHPYQTPHGPGEAIANANHAGARDFIDQHMRGCYKGEDGQLYGCQQ